jgi:hypothetical protein
MKFLCVPQENAIKTTRSFQKVVDRCVFDSTEQGITGKDRLVSTGSSRCRA